MRGILWQAYRGQKHKLLEHNKGTKSQRLGNASAEDQLIAEGKTVQIIAGGAVKPARERLRDDIISGISSGEIRP